MTVLYCHAGARPASTFSLRETLSCPAGWERSLGLGIEPSPPTRLRMRPRSAARRADPRGSASGRPTSPHSDRHARCPHAPAPWLLSPAGRISPPPSRPPCTAENAVTIPVSRLPRVVPPDTGRGAFNPPVPRVVNLSAARGLRTREPRWGDGGAALCERRGAPTRIAPSGRGRRSVRPQRLGTRKAAPSHPRHRQNISHHAVT